MNGGSEPARPPGLIRSLRAAWTLHQEFPFRWYEIWTHGGREAHQRRWIEARAAVVRATLQGWGLRIPAHWSPDEVAQLSDVVVGRCYDVEGFLPGAHDVVVDAGCGYGDFTCLCASAGARVISFDPSRENIQRTRELLEVNGLAAELHAVALGRAPGTVRLGRMGPAMLSTAGTDATREVEVRRLEDIGGGRISLLKIDVEGMEMEVLAGAETLLSRERPRVIVEVHGAAPAQKVAEYLTSRRYALTRVSSPVRSPEYGFTRIEFWAPSDRTMSEGASVPTVSVPAKSG